MWDRWSEFGDWIFRSVNEGDALNPAFTAEYQPFYGLELNYGTQGMALTLRDTTDIKAGLEFRPGRYLALRAGYARRPELGRRGRADTRLSRPRPQHLFDRLRL